MNRVIRLAEFAAEAEAMPEDPSHFLPHLNVEHLRMVEALLFASAEPLSEEALSMSLPQGSDLHALLSELQEIYARRGVNLVQVNGKWQFRTAADLAFLLRKEQPEQRRLSRAAPRLVHANIGARIVRCSVFSFCSSMCGTGQQAGSALGPATTRLRGIGAL